MLSVILLSDIILNVITLSVVLLSTDVILFIVTLLDVSRLIVILPNAVVQNINSPISSLILKCSFSLFLSLNTW